MMSDLNLSDIIRYHNGHAYRVGKIEHVSVNNDGTYGHLHIHSPLGYFHTLWSGRVMRVNDPLDINQYAMESLKNA